MRHDIGTGTVNFPVNMPRDERHLLGRVMVELGVRSIGELIRQLTLRGLEAVNLDRAVELREIRKRYYGRQLMCAALLALFLAAVLFDHGMSARARRCRRTREDETQHACPFEIV